MDLVLELKNNASKLLLAIMESRGDSENAERILYNMNPKQLVIIIINFILNFSKLPSSLNGEGSGTFVSPVNAIISNYINYK